MITTAPALCNDSATTSWIDKGAIVVNIHDRSSAGPGKYYDIYDFVADDVNVMKYFIDAYGVTGNVVLQGNSRGTMASALIIKALAGQPYHPQNQKTEIMYRKLMERLPALTILLLIRISVRTAPLAMAMTTPTGQP